MTTFRAVFTKPGPDARPTPLYWWSGADLDRECLSWQLDILTDSGVGGTIVGYAHLPDGSLDHGEPAPFSATWWQLFEWFVDESNARGLTVGLQDYGVIGPVLVSAAASTAGSHGGTLTNETHTVKGGPLDDDRPWQIDIGTRRLVSACAWDELGEPSLPGPALDEGMIRWHVPPGHFTVSLVFSEPGHIGLVDTDFDPLHPGSGQAVIDSFYEPFAERLGQRLGSTFTTFFQDELDLGLRMPMYNNEVARALQTAGYHPDEWLHALWHDRGERTGAFRAFYRDTVVAALETHYFEPIFRWHERHGTRLVMDQLSRGDLRVGHQHYADFLQTMKWYHGPGNDDPDLSEPRNLAAFRVSGSIAHLYERPLVVNEAFHSSGWGVEPRDVVRGANAGFVSGANHLILHGLYYTTEGGWWEWAAPDFHFRQPWWRHSTPMWEYLTRVGAVLRAGVNVADFALVDPTQDLDLTGENTTSPERARTLLAALGFCGVNADLVPMASFATSTVSAGRLSIERAVYRAVALSNIRTLRHETFEAIAAFARAGGVVVCIGTPPERTERRPLGREDLVGWHIIDDGDWLKTPAAPDSLTAALGRALEPDVDVDVAGVAVAHRRGDGDDAYFFVNLTERSVTTFCRIRTEHALERLDLWSGMPGGGFCAHRQPDGRQRFELHLEPGEAALILAEPAKPTENSENACSCPGNPALRRPTASVLVHLDGPWTAELVPTLDNTFGDFDSDSRPTGVETWHVEVAESADGPWRAVTVGYRHQFWALGPIDASDAPAVTAEVIAHPTVRDRPDWRPYSFSDRIGIENDPLLLDRMTGPHGLKGVSQEFLDPRALDEHPPAGSVYLFCSTVSPDSVDTLTVSGRTASTVYFNGARVSSRTETDPAYFEPWGLRDLSSERSEYPIVAVGGPGDVVVAVTVAASQPSRVAVAFSRGPAPDAAADRLAWWREPRPAARFEPAPQHVASPARSIFIGADIPPGATNASLEVAGQIIGARLDGIETTVHQTPSGGEIIIEHPAKRLVVEVEGAAESVVDAGQLTAPIRWRTIRGPVELGSWTTCGLADFSGSAIYSTTVDLTSGEIPEVALPSAWLDIEGLVGTAAVRVNGRPAGIILTMPRLPVGSFLRMGKNTFEIDVANTLANHYARLPSPYSAMQRPGGGFSGARLDFNISHTHRADDAPLDTQQD